MNGGYSKIADKELLSNMAAAKGRKLNELDKKKVLGEDLQREYDQLKQELEEIQQLLGR